MDLRAFYQQIRKEEAELPVPCAIITSLATPDGGKEGVVTEVPTIVAARMIVEGKARRSTENEITTFHEKQAADRQAAEREATATRVQVMVMPVPQSEDKKSQSPKKES